MPTVTLKPGHVQPVWAGHPWVYAQAIEHITGGASPGDEIDVVDARGNFLGRGLYSPSSAIPVRVFSRSPARFDLPLLVERLQRARLRRQSWGLPASGTSGYRLVHSEGDDLPGLIVDRFGETLVIQLGTVGMKNREGMVHEALRQVMKPRAIVDRTSLTAARREHFEPSAGVVWGDLTLAELQFDELGLQWMIPLGLGQKTGYYFDQRPLRQRVGELARGRRVLDAYSYVGSMGLAATRGGASETVSVDSSALAIEVAAECAARNGFAGRIQFLRADAREYLNQAGREGGFDLVVCDPPKLAPSRGAQRLAGDAMRRLAASACRATRPGGYLALCSCSATLGMGELARALALGARDVGLKPAILERLFQGPDHPVPAACPEGLYLCTLIAEIQTA